MLAALEVGLPCAHLRELYMPETHETWCCEHRMRGIARAPALRKLQCCLLGDCTLLRHQPPPRWITTLQHLHLRCTDENLEPLWLHQQIRELQNLRAAA